MAWCLALLVGWVNVDDPFTDQRFLGVLKTSHLSDGEG